MDSKLLTQKGYYERFISYVKEGYTHKAAWEKTQLDVDKEFGPVETKGFTSFESFKTSLRGWFKEKKV